MWKTVPPLYKLSPHSQCSIRLWGTWTDFVTCQKHTHSLSVFVTLWMSPCIVFSCFFLFCLTLSLLPLPVFSLSLSLFLSPTLSLSCCLEHTNSHTHKHTHIHTRAHTHKHTHTQIHTHTHTHTQTLRHTHTTAACRYICIYICINWKFKLNKNLNLNLYRKIPRNSIPIKISIRLCTVISKIPRNLVFSVWNRWLKSLHHSGFRLPFNSAFRVSSSTERAVLPTNRFVSTTKISMKCVVNWIPLRIRVRPRNTQLDPLHTIKFIPDSDTCSYQNSIP